MSGNIEIDDIIKACQKGERSAQKALYECFAPKMLGVCLRYSSDRESAEDFLQDGFIRIFEKIEQYRFEGSFEGWIRKIIVNMIIESYRKKRIQAELTDDFPDISSDEELPDEPESPAPSLNELLSLVKQLPERYRLVFNLYVIEELTHDEIASRLGISQGTSKSNLSRARRWLQDRLQEKSKMEIVR